jgi:hypothetical protein
MSASVQFRIQLPLNLRDKFKAICARRQVTMTDRLIGLIEQDVSKTSLAPPPQAKIATLNDDRLIARVVEAADRLGSTATSLGTGLSAKLDSLSKQIVAAMPKPLSAEQIATLHERAATAQASQNTAMLSKTDSFFEHILDQSRSHHQATLLAIRGKTKLWHWGAGGLVLGSILMFACLGTLRGTSTARALAVWMSGEDSRWHAAQAIAGNGSVLHSAYMSETHTLLGNAEFRDSYVHCVERSKARKSSFACTLRFPALTPAP